MATYQPNEGPVADAPASFAAMLRRDREESGMSLGLLALKMETSPAYLFRLEKGIAARPGRNFTIRLGIVLYLDDIERLDQLLLAAGCLPCFATPQSCRLNFALSWTHGLAKQGRLILGQWRSVDLAPPTFIWLPAVNAKRRRV